MARKVNTIKKSGFAPINGVEPLFSYEEVLRWQHLKICTMATSVRTKGISSEEQEWINLSS